MSKTVYLAGPMEYVKDEGLAWRRKYNKTLSKNFGFKCIVPNDEEKNIKKKVNMKELKKIDLNKYISIMREFIKMDLAFIKKVDMVVCHWEGEMSAGTMSEVTYAYDLEKPVYLITSLSPQDIPGWFLACFTAVFSSLEELVEYLRKIT